MLAVKGHTPDSVIATLAERVRHDAQHERSVALREICRIAYFRLADLVQESLGDAIIAMAEELASLERGQRRTDLLVPHADASRHRRPNSRFHDGRGACYPHRCRRQCRGRAGRRPNPKRVLTGSHYDTVINAGKYDGRLGILLPVAVAGSLRRSGMKLPYPLEIIAFAEEEGVRFKSTFFGSRAVAGRFDLRDLDSVDAGGTTLSEATARRRP